MKWLIYGFTRLKTPGIKRYVYLPIALNIILFIITYAIAGHYWHELTHYLTSFLPSWLQWLTWLLWLIFAILALVIMGICFSAIAMLIGAPFYGMLAEKTQIILNGPKLPETGWHHLFKSLPQSLMTQIKIMLLYLIPMAIALCFTFIPILHIIVTVICFLLGARLQFMQNMNIVFENNIKHYQELKNFYRSQRISSLGFGSGILFLLMIPIVNLFVLPAAVIGATAWYCDRISVE